MLLRFRCLHRGLGRSLAGVCIKKPIVISKQHRNPSLHQQSHSFARANLFPASRFFSTNSVSNKTEAAARDDQGREKVTVIARLRRLAYLAPVAGLALIAMSFSSIIPGDILVEDQGHETNLSEFDEANMQQFSQAYPNVPKDAIKSLTICDLSDEYHPKMVTVIARLRRLAYLTPVAGLAFIAMSFSQVIPVGVLLFATGIPALVGGVAYYIGNKITQFPIRIGIVCAYKHNAQTEALDKAWSLLGRVRDSCDPSTTNSLDGVLAIWHAVMETQLADCGDNEESELYKYTMVISHFVMNAEKLVDDRDFECVFYLEKIGFELKPHKITTITTLHDLVEMWKKAEEKASKNKQ